MARTLGGDIETALAGLQMFPFFCLDFTDGDNLYKYTTLDVPTTIIGSELITVVADRDFSSGQGNWTVEDGDDVTWDNVSMNWDCDERNEVRLAVPLTEGEVYKIEFDVSAYTSGDMNCYLGSTDSSSSSYKLIEPSGVTSYNINLTAGAYNFIQFNKDDFIGSLDNVSIKLFSEYQSRGFEFESINYTLSNVMDDCTLRIDNLDSVLTSIFVDGTVEETTATVHLGLLDTDNTVLGTVSMFTGEVDSFELDETEVRLVIGSIFTRWGNQAYNKHSASCRWKVFKGTECAYAGAQTWCDRSYARCAVLANTANFGGFRFLPSIENKKIWWGPTPAQR